MKRFINISTSVILLLLLFGGAQNKATAQEEQVSYQTFYDELEPYGSWIDYPDYGYVWHPDAGPDFRPYNTNGHWVWNDDYEWMWVSDYSWGWAPFHYGRWFFDDYYGWLWVPGYDWSPAWVCWRSGGDYYGWAPLGPQFSIGVNLSFGRYSPPANYWCFVDRQYIASPRVYDHCYGVQRNAVFINNTTIINNYRRERNVFVTGPGRREVERYTRQPIRSVAVRDVARPGRTMFRNNEISIYRPRVNRDNNHFAPARVQRFNRNQRNDVADNRGVWNRQGNNIRGFEERRQQQERIMRGNNDANRRQFEQRQQQDQMMRQRNDMQNNRRQFEQHQEQDQMMRQRNDMQNNRRQFEQRQQQDQIMRQRNEMQNNHRQFEQRQQQGQMMRQRNEMENNRRQFEQRQQRPQFQQRSADRPGGFGGFRGQPQQRPQPQAQPQQRGGGDRGDRGQGHGGWRHGR